MKKSFFPLIFIIFPLLVYAAPRIPRGTTVYGQVVCDGQPIAGVVVSDGDVLVKTDSRGWYFMKSDKEEGSVFVSFPGGTEVPVEKGMPRFWQRLSSRADSLERHDFALRRVQNDNFVMLAVSDIHLANIYDDRRQFGDIFIPRLREEAASYASAGVPVYCLNGGDSSYDRYWYEYLYAIEDFPRTLEEVDFPVAMFSAIGNHDNDGATPRVGDVDFAAAERYRRSMGPTRYSFNLGEVHCIVLDDVVYKNSEGRIDTYEGISGRRDYEVYFRDDELDWLRRDLATVTDYGTPIVVLLHVPLFAHRNEDESKPIVSKMKKTGADPDELLREFTALFRGFEQVHFVSGHTHKTKVCYGSDAAGASASNGAADERFPDLGNCIDHNVSGVCGVWWMSRCFGGASLACDSAPSGFEVFKVEGRQLKWYFVSNDDGADRQFSVYDMNSVREFYRTDGEMRSFMHHYPNRTDYSTIEDNVLLIHVWAWDSRWKISVRENGRELPVTAQKAENPQFALEYYLPKAGWEDNEPDRWPQKYNKPILSPHFFRVQASAPDTTVEISVTDGFGNVYTQTVERPKTFSKLLNY